MKDFEYSKIKGIKSVILYGSKAKGHSDDFSDTDVLVIADKLSSENSELLKKELERRFNNRNLDMSIYSPEDFDIMLKCGSLFLWHVKLDGIVLYGDDKEQIFAKLSEFKGVYEDTLLYNRLLTKAKMSLSQNGANYFDLNQLALLARNTLIILCYYNDRPRFGKYDVFDECISIFKNELPLARASYYKLQSYRMFYKRGVDYIDLPSDSEVSDLIDEVEKTIGYALNNIKLYNSIDRVYYLLKNKIDRNLYASFEIFTEFERDLFITLQKIIKKQCNEDLYGLEIIHRNRLKLETIKKEDFNPIDLGFKIYDSLKSVRKKLVTYGPETTDIFHLSPITQGTILGIESDKLLQIIETNSLIIAMKNSKIKALKNMANSLNKSIEKRLEIKLLLNRMGKYRKYLEKDID